MSINVKSIESDRMREELDRKKDNRCHKPLSDELLEIGRRCAAHVKRPLKSSDHANMLYDSNGLPR
jgi:hypothetical protein